MTAKTTKFADLHGYLKKKSRHDRWQKRWFEANDHYLTYYKSPQSEKLLACIDLYQTGSIKLATEDDQAPGDESYSEFSLELGDRFYIIKAETRGDAKWDSAKSLLTVTLPIVHDFDSKLVATSASNELD